MITNRYQNIGEGSVASYSYTDIAEGTGIVIFNGFGYTTSTGEGYSASQSSFYADPIETELDGNGGTDTKTLTFDVAPFNLPKTIGGTAYIEGSWAVETSVGNAGNGKITFEVQKVGGAALGSVVTETVACSGTQVKRQSFLLPLTLTKMHFKRGEILRISVEMSVTTTGGTGVSMYLAHDPQNRDGTLVTPAVTYHTDLNFHIPFQLDL